MPELTPFLSWVAHHARLFGLAKEEAATMAGWESTLDASPDELHAATAAIAGNPGETLGEAKSRFSGKMVAHLEAITRVLRRVKRMPGANGETPHEWGTCIWCDSTGWVVVPHLRCVQGGEWRPDANSGCYYTFAVLCSCALGKWKRDRRQDTPFTIERYQVLNPAWREQMEHRRGVDKQYAATVSQLKREPDMPRVRSVGEVVEARLLPFRKGEMSGPR